MFSAGWMDVGNVQRSPLADILGSATLTKEVSTIRSATRSVGACDPACDPNAECTPGFPSGECDPRR
ncbi:hypothetical protein ACH4GK_06075 [Streptomyces rimosus]|uniref:hypothetical protein n=1 Tax=Streptomyces rimosus TaxID=1927 RepID=UPI001F1C9915|nr:hypothetical protein [Streptomyces rimosus]